MFEKSKEPFSQCCYTAIVDHFKDKILNTKAILTIGHSFTLYCEDINLVSKTKKITKAA